MHDTYHGDFGATRDVAITILVDNRADLIVRSTDTVKYFTEKPLLAEHGFAALIELKGAGTRILWDAGMTQVALLENARRMQVDLAAVDQIVLSHGHGDHTAAVTDVLRGMELRPEAKDWPPGTPADELVAWARGRRVPVIAHPAAFHERWGVRRNGTRHGPIQPPPRQEWEALGAEIVLSEEPYRLAPGCWVTGFVPRRTFEKSGRPTNMLYREGEAFLPDDVAEDQAIAIHVEDKGLVILSGCAHSGIVNTVNYAREISGVDRVWAILGGFHLARATAEELEQTIAEIKGFGPALIAPSHCTGFQPICRFAAEMPEAFALGLVGTTYLF
jgi:7,8-dihydropterin-6-yl-methyl-4-(beta-D-ribofuranosyl)aminobenzene 5'-phosphate synthase